MNINYECTGSTVLVEDGKGKLKKRNNVDNISTILKLENAKEEVSNYLNNYKRINKEISKDVAKLRGGSTLLVGGFSAASLFYFNILSKINIPDVLGCSGSALLAASTILPASILTYVGLKKFNKDRMDVIKPIRSENNSKIKSISLFNYALDKELELEKNKSNNIVKDQSLKSVSNDIVKSSLFKDYSNYHKIFMKDYLDNGLINDEEYNERENRILTNMMEKELNSSKTLKKVK